MNRSILHGAILWMASGGAWAQTPPESPAAHVPTFSIVSVKRSDPKATKPSFQLRPDGLSIRHYVLLWLLQNAYHLPEERLVLGVPHSTDEEYYDIDAKVDEEDMAALAKLSQQERFAMLQPVLEDRFKLKYHYETKELPDFALVVAKDGPNAENLKPSSAEDTKPTWKYTGHYALAAKGFTMENLCFVVLSTEAQRFVVDRTGLTGHYDISLRWSRDTPPPADGSAAPEPAGPSIFTAVQEQLGLKLEPIKVATKILVVDSVERPSGNEK